MAELHAMRLNSWMRLSFLQEKLRHAYRVDPVMTVAVGVAILLHLLFIFAVTFVPPRGDQATMQDIALAVSQSKDDNPDADYLAQANQQGAGVLRTAHRLTSPAQAQNQNQQMHVQNVTIHIIQQSESQETSVQGDRAITTTTSQHVESQSEKNKRAHRMQRQQESQQSSSTAAMIATLEAQYSNEKQEYSKMGTVHTVDSVSTRADPSAVYLNQFRRKVEKIGNHNYPEAARNQGLKGDVRLKVVLMPDGSIQHIILMQTSGSHLLDEAAINSVREGAPYGHFDKAMKGYSQLHIIRTWRFSDQDDLEVEDDQ